MTIGEHHAFRVTRNADLALEEDEADDLLVAIEMELRRRVRRALRLEVEADMGQELGETCWPPSSRWAPTAFSGSGLLST